MKQIPVTILSGFLRARKKLAEGSNDTICRGLREDLLREMVA
jgi:hypothetical protein